jgi:predicted negative regulator of RcsB-dependent stress response
MFSFLKNLFGTNNNENSANENIKKTIDTESLEKEFIQLKKQLSTSNDNNIIELLNKLGEVCTNLNKIDDAISYYEQSLKNQICQLIKQEEV